MKSIPAFLLIALALVPLSGSRAVTPVGAHARAAADSDDHRGYAVVHHHDASGGHETAAAVPLHGVIGAHGPQDASTNPCAGDHASSTCCSLSCHAVTPHVGVSVPAPMQVAMLIDLVALPLPRGVGFEGLLRPPRQG